MRGRIVVMVSVLGLLVAGPAWAQRCEHSRDIEAAVDAAGAAEGLLVSEAGELRVEGVEGISEVRVRGRACASDEGRLDEMEVVARRSGDRVEVVAEIDDRGWSWRGNRYATIDLEIEVPAGLPLEIEDGSGNLFVRGVAAARIEDGSGNIEVEDVAGDLWIDDGSGNLDVRDVAGDVRIEDGSGNIDVRGAGGEVRIDDGSGNVDVHGAGSVWIDDGSGGISIEDVRGDVVVHEDGSGGIDVRRVGGDFIVRDDGSGGIRHEEVAGRVDIPGRRR